MNKGQVFLSDLVSSMAVFSLFLMLFGVAWNTSIDKLDDNKVEKRGERTFDLIRSEGYPQNWNSSDVEVPGIYSDGHLNRTKLLRLKNLDESRNRKLLKTQEYLLKAEYLNGTILSKNGEGLRTSSSDIPEDRSVYTYREIGLTASDKKRVKLSYFRWRG